MNKNVNVRAMQQNEVLSFFTSNKKNHFNSEAKLFDTLDNAVRAISNVFTIHLTTYPNIAVHVVCGNADLLNEKKDLIENEIKKQLEQQLKS